MYLSRATARLRPRSFDWGYAAPFSVGWRAVASDPFDAGGEKPVPRGALAPYREVRSNGRPNEVMRLDAEAVAAGILERKVVSVMDGLVREMGSDS